MKTFIALLMLVSATAFAAPMGPEAVEMAKVMSNGDAQQCLSTVNLDQMIDVKIEKKVARCPMCNTYVITGRDLIGGDVPANYQTQITLTGRGVPGFGFGFVQTFKCDIKKI